MAFDGDLSTGDLHPISSMPMLGVHKPMQPTVLGLCFYSRSSAAADLNSYTAV